MGKSTSILHEELQQVFGESTVPSLRTLQLWVASIRAGTFTTMLLIAFTCSPARFSITALPKRVTVTGEYMVEFYKATGNRFNNIKQNKIKFKELILQTDNARPHTAARTQMYLEGTGVTMLSQSAYSPDLNLCDRFLFTILQRHCRAMQYADGNELEMDVKRFLRQLPDDLLKHELDKLREHCRSVIRAEGAYVTD